MQKQDIYAGRINSLEVYRGISLACVVFFHAAIYNYGGIASIDLQNPPLLVLLIGIMGLWGGIFVILSLITSTLAILRSLSDAKRKKRILQYVGLTGGLLLLLDYIMFLFLGRWALDPGSPDAQMSLIPGLLRNYHADFPSLASIFDASILSTIGLNLLLIGSLVYLLFRQSAKSNEKRAYAVLSGLALLMLVASFARVELHPLLGEAVASQDYVSAILLGWVAGAPYPIITYSLYGLIGAIIGVMLHYGRLNYIKSIAFPIGIGLLGIGVAGCLSQPLSFNKPDLFWQWKAIADLGVFLLIAVFALGIVQPKQNGMRHYTLFMWISRISLTVYVLETSMSELLRHAWFVVLPGWNQSILGTLVFSAFNVIWWLVVVYLWSRIKFRYSLEYFWIKLFGKFGKKSTKLDHIQGL